MSELKEMIRTAQSSDKKKNKVIKVSYIPEKERELSEAMDKICSKIKGRQKGSGV